MNLPILIPKFTKCGLAELLKSLLDLINMLNKLKEIELIQTSARPGAPQSTSFAAVRLNFDLALAIATGSTILSS